MIYHIMTNTKHNVHYFNITKQSHIKEIYKIMPKYAKKQKVKQAGIKSLITIEMSHIKYL